MKSGCGGRSCGFSSTSLRGRWYEFVLVKQVKQVRRVYEIGLRRKKLRFLEHDGKTRSPLNFLSLCCAFSLSLSSVFLSFSVCVSLYLDSFAALLSLSRSLSLARARARSVSLLCLSLFLSLSLCICLSHWRALSLSL
jgi:hypothetical protein